jgi:hypothetical protein
MARRTLKDRAKKQPATKRDAAVFTAAAPRPGGNRTKKPKPVEEPQFRTHEQMLSVRLPAELLEKLAKLADRRRNARRVPYTKTAIVVEALAKYLKASR